MKEQITVMRLRGQEVNAACLAALIEQIGKGVRG